MFPIFGLSDVFSWFGWGFTSLADIDQKWFCPQCIVSRITCGWLVPLLMTLTLVTQLTKILSYSFLHCKLTIFPFGIWEYVDICLIISYTRICVKQWLSNCIVITAFTSWHSTTRKNVSFLLFIYLYHQGLVNSYFIQWILNSVF